MLAVGVQLAQEFCTFTIAESVLIVLKVTVLVHVVDVGYNCQPNAVRFVSNLERHLLQIVSRGILKSLKVSTTS